MRHIPTLLLGPVSMLFPKMGAGIPQDIICPAQATGQKETGFRCSSIRRAGDIMAAD
jgi:hypothetical protein